MRAFLRKHPIQPARLVLWLLIYAFLLSYLHPELLITDTICTGGDTASHYYTAVYLKDHLLPQGRLLGWQPGNYAGFPLFQFYFPLAFLLMVALSLAMPLTVAFKIVTVLGILALPYGVYRLLKDMEFKPPVPDLGAVFSLAMLFMESNSAWGGNIPSTLAGEFAYSLGLTLALVYLGRMYRDMASGRRVVGNALILALVGLSHGYTVLFCVFGAGFFLIATDRWIARLVYVLKVNLLAFCFMGFWIVPLLVLTPYTTAYNFVWAIKSWREVVPVILWPFAAMGLAGLLFSLTNPKEDRADRRRSWFFVYLILVAGLFYFVANKIGVVDIRFIPFGQLLLVALGAAAAGRVVRRLRTPHLAALTLALASVTWITHHVTFIDDWAAWNYGGYESKPLWPAFKQVNDRLRGGMDDPRVVYEHAAQITSTGSLRAFESLPFFANRATLEGLYLQSSLSSPFIFYIQSEISQEFSAPILNYNYSRFDLNRAREHLHLFNVGEFVSVTDETTAVADRTPGYRAMDRVFPFSVYRLVGNEDRYVIQPRFRPVLVVTEDPQADAFTWFRWSDLQVPLAFTDRSNDSEAGRFAAVVGSDRVSDALKNPPHQSTTTYADLRETVRNDEIVIEGARPGQPLWIRVSYHPNWKVEGAERIWRASPAFMLVFPERETVRLYFARSTSEYAGLGLTILGLFYALTRRRGLFHGRLPDLETLAARLVGPLAARLQPHARLILVGAVMSAAGFVLFMIFGLHTHDPAVIFQRGLKLYEKKDYLAARRVFEEGLREFPLSPVVDHTLHRLALTYFDREEYDDARTVWSRFRTEYPESRVLPEALYHIGLCDLRQNRRSDAEAVFKDLMARFPGGIWAGEAGRRLDELGALNQVGLFQQAMNLFDQKKYDEARTFFIRARDQGDDRTLAERAAYFAAVSLTRAERWEAARSDFLALAQRDPAGPFAAEAYYHLGLIALKRGDRDEAGQYFRLVMDRYPHSRWSRESQNMLERAERGADG